MRCECIKIIRKPRNHNQEKRTADRRSVTWVFVWNLLRSLTLWLMILWHSASNFLPSTVKFIAKRTKQQPEQSLNALFRLYFCIFTYYFFAFSVGVGVSVAVGFGVEVGFFVGSAFSVGVGVSVSAGVGETSSGVSVGVTVGSAASVGVTGFGASVGSGSTSFSE